MTEPKPNGNDNSTEEIESRRSCLWRMLSVGAWSILVLMLMVFGFRVWFQSTLDPARKSEMEKFDNEIIALPPDWQIAAKVPSKDLIKFQKRFFEVMTRVTKKHLPIFQLGPMASGKYRKPTSGVVLLQKLQRNDVLTSTDQKLIDNFVVDFRPVVEETSRGVSLPGYTSNLFHYSVGTDFFAMSNFAQGASVMAFDLARKGHWRQAMEVGTLPMRYIRHEPRAIMIHQLVGIGAITVTLETCFALAEQCNDPTALQLGLDLLNNVRDVAHLDHPELMTYGTWAGPLAAAKAAGYPVDFSPQPMSGYYRQMLDVLGMPYQNWIIANLSSSDPRVAEARKTLAILKREQASLPWNKRILMMAARQLGDMAPLVFGYSTTAMLYEPPNFMESPTMATVASAYYELVRLRFAQRLAELETGAVAPIGPDTVQSYLGTIPNDPFSTTSASLLFSSAHNQFYSIGPDEDNDGMKMQYDAINGSDSNGDIFIP